MTGVLDWLADDTTHVGPPTTDVILGRTAFAVGCGFAAAGVYWCTAGRRRRGADDGLPTTLVLLCVLVSVVTLVIGGSTARAFGLVGALSVIRFRTAVADARDTAFVIFAVALGMAAGVGYASLALVAIPAVLFAALVMHRIDRPGWPTATLTVRVALGVDPAPLLAGPLAALATSATETAAGTAKQGTCVEVVYKAALRPGVTPAAAVLALTSIEGVKEAEVKPG